MRPKSRATDLSSEEVVKEIRRATRKRYSAEEKIGIVLDGLRGGPAVLVPYVGGPEHQPCSCASSGRDAHHPIQE